jgi:simple sugar transport system ATP-binding protein
MTGMGGLPAAAGRHDASMASTVHVPSIEAVGMTKRFGPLLALDGVSLAVVPGSFHAILGENGAGKSTLVKCIMGYHRPDAGQLLVDGVRRSVHNPRQALGLGLGLVYQHFTLVPSMTAAENLVLAQERIPAVIDWDEARARIAAFQRSMPFAVDPDARVTSLSAGEKQKLEILKQLYLGRRVLILDEPTSVLTPAEADEVLGMLRDLAQAGTLSVVLITHKFREVLAFATQATVLRNGRVVGSGRVAELGESELGAMMFGRGTAFAAARREERAPGPTLLEVSGVCASNDKGVPACRGIGLGVRAGEILGVAGVAGNGQRELVEVLAGQREATAGEIRVHGEAYRGTRRQMHRCGVHLLTDEPLDNACVRAMSVAENLSFHRFDQPPHTALGVFVRERALREAAGTLIRRFGIRAPDPDARIDTLSGGNVQRTVLARELSGDVRVLVAQNPCVGLDVAATRDIRAQIVAARNRGAAILLFSEDLDELLELSDRIVVMFEGRLVHETTREAADVATIGLHMASHRGEGRTASAIPA